MEKQQPIKRVNPWKERRLLPFLLWIFLFLSVGVSGAQTRFTVVELNTENLFDTHHDSLKNDYEFLPTSSHHWTVYRYWEKLNKIGQEIVACGKDSAAWSLPDLVGLCEVENDTVLRDLTKRSVLRTSRYEYVMTDSPDERGIDVALLYSPFSFGYISSHSLRVKPMEGMRPTRDILYVCGRLITGDTLHVFVAHAPSRSGGEKLTRPFRVHVAEKLCQAIDSVRKTTGEPLLLVMGDFNDYWDSPSVRLLSEHGMVNVSKVARGDHGAKGTYRFRGEWGSLDQMLVSPSLLGKVRKCRIGDMQFLLEEDKKYGSVKPRRFYQGPRYNGGFSDHLPLILTLSFQ